MDLLFIVQLLAMIAGNLLIGAIGFIPSFFMTALNISLYGLGAGLLLSLIGEVFGVWIGFHLYRFGFSKMKDEWRRHRLWRYLHSRNASQIFFGIIAFRLLPFVPSGLVTAAASATPIRSVHFLAASTIGKIPAVAFEVGAVYGFTQLVPAFYQYLILALLLAATLLGWVFTKHRSAK
jgi:uncharacterized membrane protein YdjX (TVP38/TMEM64 family)